MTPDELRGAAERHYHCQSSERDMGVLIEAARRLEAAMGVYDKWMMLTADRCSEDAELILSDLCDVLHEEMP